MIPEASAPAKVPGPGDFPARGPNSLASVGQRALARLVDLAIVGLPALLLVVPFVHIDGDKAVADVPRWVGVVALAIAVSYEVVFIAWRGQTIGKWVVGVRVARYADGKKPTFSQSSLRSLLPACFLAIPVPVIDTGWLVVFLSSLYHPLRRGWHDKAGGTIVVRTR